MKKLTYLSLGANLGNRQQQLSAAKSMINAQIGDLMAISELYETQVWGQTMQADYLNQVVAVATELSPQQLLERCLRIELDLGRIRLERWGPRLIDIDIISYEGLIVEQENLQIPHPRLHLRRFVLAPLCEIAPDWMHPVFNQSAQTLLQNCEDSCRVEKFLI